MALGSVNIPGISAIELKTEIESLIAALMSGELIVPLSTVSGEVITTESGEEILAYQISGAAYTDQAVASAVATVSERVDGLHKDYSKAIIAV